MRPRDWFCVGVRLLGVWVLIRGVTDLLHLGSSILGLSPESTSQQWHNAHAEQMYNLWYAAGILAFSLYLIFGAEHLTRWAYKEQLPSIDDDGSGDSE